MNPQQVAQALQVGFTSPISEEREAAEQQLQQFENDPQYPGCLAQIMTATDIPLPIRQAASVYWKRLVQRRWSPRSKKYTELSPETKQLIKQNIVELIIHVPLQLKIHLSLSLLPVLEREFPQAYPELIPKIVSYIKSDNKSFIFGGLYALRIVVRKYESKPSANGVREGLNEIVSVTFPLLYKLTAAVYNQLQANPTQPVESFEFANMLLLLCKIFWSGTQFILPPLFSVEKIPDLGEGGLENLMNWLNLFLQILKFRIPESQTTEFGDLWWQVSKWVLHIFTRFYSRYNVKESQDPPFVVMFGQHFCKEFVPNVLGVMFELLPEHICETFSNSHKFIIPDKLVAILLNFVGLAIRQGSTYTLLKQTGIIGNLYQKIIYPVLCFNEKDNEMWDEDPGDYLKRECDFLDDFWDPRMTGTQLLVDLVTYRGKHHLSVIAEHCATMLNGYDVKKEQLKNSGQSGEGDSELLELARRKEGAFVVLGNLCGKLKKLEVYAKNLEGILVRYAFPELNSPFRFLRARAAWVVGQFYDIDWAQDTFVFGLKEVLRLTHDKDLVVRVKAALSLRLLLCQPQGIAVAALRPHLGELLEVFFSLMKELDNDEVVKGLQTIIDKYSDEIEPYAIELCRRLAGTVLNYVETNDLENDDDGAAITIEETLTALRVLLDAVDAKHDMIRQLEPMVTELCSRLLEDDCMEFFDDCLKIIEWMTFCHPDGINERMWQLFPKMYKAFDSWAVDWLDQMVTSFDNFVSKGTDAFLAGSWNGMTFLEMGFRMFERVVGEKGISPVDAIQGCNVAEVLLLNCKGKIDNLIEPILKSTLSRLMSEDIVSGKNPACETLLIAVIANCLYYNPELTLQLLFSGDGMGGRVAFERLGNYIKGRRLRRLKDMKIIMLGLSSILLVPWPRIPDTMKAGMKDVFVLILGLHDMTVTKKKEIEELPSDSDDYSSGADDDDDDIDVENEFDEVADGDDVDGGSADLKGIQTQLAQYSWKARDLAGLDGEDDDAVDQLEDSLIVTSVVDNVDESHFFVEANEVFAKTDLSVYQQLVGALTEQEQNYYRNLVAWVQDQKQQAQQQQQQFLSTLNQ